jgi:hypothetical protein
MMKKIGIIAIVTIMLIPLVSTPTLSSEIEENELDFRWKVLVVIGRINVCFDEKTISGFALVGYTAGETLVLERIDIQFDGIPLFINNGLLFSFCFYKSAIS